MGEGVGSCTCIREVSPEAVDTQGVDEGVGEGVGGCTCVREVPPEVVDTQGV